MPNIRRLASRESDASLTARVRFALSGRKAVMYDFTDLTTLYQDAAGTTPVTTTAQPIGLAFDRSGCGNHATQSTAGLRPLLRANNGKCAAQFDGVDDALMLPNIAWAGGALNSFVASNVGASTRAMHVWRTAGAYSSYWGVFESGSGNSPEGEFYGRATYAVNGVAVSPSTRAQLYTLMNSRNTVLESIGVTLSANSALQIGGYSGYVLSGPVHRILLVEGALNSGQIALFRKWAGRGIGLNL